MVLLSFSGSQDGRIFQCTDRLMASFRPLVPLFFFLPLFLLATPISPSPPPSLLAFNCSSSSSLTGATQAKQTLETLLRNLTKETHHAASQRGELHAFLQCRPRRLWSTRFTRCAQDAVEAMATLCSSSSSISAWFDDCYIQYYYNTSSPQYSFFTSQANRTNGALDRRRFDLALNMLIPQLRVENRVTTRERFSTGEIAYGAGLRIFALMECLQFLAPEQCDSCLANAVARSRRCCNGAAGATVV